MKTQLLIVAVLCCITSCSITKKVSTSPVVVTKKMDNEELIIGKWKMTASDKWGSDDPTPKADVTWEFNERHECSVSSIAGKQATQNTGMYWTKSNLLKVDEQIYLFSFPEPHPDDTKRTQGNVLKLDPNYTPGLSSHGTILWFERIM